MSTMKNTILIGAAILTMLSVQAQDIKSSLDAAQTAYAANESLQARENLQQSLIDLNNLIGKEILALMPSSLGSQAVVSDKDNVMGGTGFAGLLVNRTYSSEKTKEVNITLANESPMIAMVNAFLSNPMLSGLMGSQTGQKKVTIHGYKGMLERSDDEGSPLRFTINVPLDDSLYTFESIGFDSEQEVINMAQQIPLDKIASFLK